MMLIVMPFDLVPGVQHSFLADFVVPEVRSNIILR